MADIKFNCPKCNAEFTVSDSLVGRLAECSECKTRIRISDTNLKPLITSTNQDQSNDHKNCPHCNKEIIKNGKICPHCGKKLSVYSRNKIILIVGGILLFVSALVIYKTILKSTPTWLKDKIDKTYTMGAYERGPMTGLLTYSVILTLTPKRFEGNEIHFQISWVKVTGSENPFIKMMGVGSIRITAYAELESGETRSNSTSLSPNQNVTDDCSIYIPEVDLKRVRSITIKLGDENTYGLSVDAPARISFVRILTK